MAERIDLFDPTVLSELITRIISPDSDAHISGVISGPNGSYFRVGDLQVCWGQRTLEYGNGDLVQATWTHPAPFAENPVAFASIRDITYGGNLTLLTVVRANTAPATTLLRVYRLIGNTNFVAGNNIVVNALAVGRWR
ncbi:MAG: hypothetical protein WDA03_08345 [Trueperaceae bacterium]